MYKNNKNSLRGQSRFSRFKKENIVQEIIFTKYAIRIEGNKIKLSLSKRMQEKYEIMKI
jgi:cell division protein FtsI/penicillin-binding protein 2